MNLNFLIIGPQKAGTTWIYEYLKYSNNICLPKGVKETFFWDKYYQKGINWYFSHFKDCRKNKKFGEVGPTYFSNQDVPKRVVRYFPEIKIVVTLRNPYERTWSLYLHKLRYGFVSGSFQEAIKCDFSIIDSSLYSKHLSNWFNYFDSSQFLITTYNELKENPEEFIKNILNFLEIPFFYKKELFKKSINKSELPRNFFIAKVSNMVAHYFRSYRLYWMIELAKKVGLKSLIFGGRKELPKPTKDDLDIMEKYFAKDIDNLYNLLENKNINIILNIKNFGRDAYEKKLFER